jgi:hypothetical protein
MKHLIETKMVEQKTEKWFADDGKEFDNEKDCVVYERRKNEEKVVKEFKKLKPKFLDIPILEWFYGSDAEVVSVNLKDEFDFIVVEDYFAIKSSYMDMCGLIEKKPIEYPCNILITSGCEWVDIYGTESDLKTKLEELVAKLK